MGGATAFAAAREGRRERDRAAVARHEIGGDRKTETGAGVVGRLVERLEDAVALVGRKPGAGVADLDQRDALGADCGKSDRPRPFARCARGGQRLRGVAA